MYVLIRMSNINTFSEIRNISEMLILNVFWKVISGDKRIDNFVGNRWITIHNSFCYKTHLTFLQYIK